MSGLFPQDLGLAGLFYLPSGRERLVAEKTVSAGYTFVSCDVQELAGSQDVLLEIGKALAFPAWYGANFDALYDCLTDPDWKPASGHVLMVSGLQKFQTSSPQDFSTLLDVFRAAAESHREHGTPFWILIDIAAPGISVLPTP